MASDQKLLHAWRAGDRRAGSELFARHFDGVYRFFLNKVDGGVEDLVQRTFVACVEGRDRFREEASFRTYLFAIAHNLLKVHLRTTARSRRQDFERDSLVDLGAGPPTIVGACEEERLVVHALRKIPIESQVLLELFYWEDLGVADIAVAMDVPVGTAATRLRRARQLLEAEMVALAGDAALRDAVAGGFETWARALRAQR